MTETAGMRALLDLEDAAPDVLWEPVPGAGTLFWPLARWPVSRAVAESDIGTTVPTYPSPTLRQRVERAVRRSLPNPFASARAPRADHLFIVTGWTKSPAVGGYVNWLSDAFADALGDDAVVVQDAFLDRLSRGMQRPVQARTFSYARALERITRRTEASPLSEADEQRLRRVLEEVFGRLPFEVTDAARERAIGDALGRARRAPHAEREFARLLDRVQPRRIYMQAAAYGDRAPLVRLARSRGIAVSELQHGWIGSSHAAYNFGAAMARSPLVEHLPDTLLSFGSFWGENVRFPGRIVPIGKPALDALRASAPAYEERAPRVLFVSSAFAHETVERTVLALRDALPDGWTVVVRPHPSEIATIASKLPRLAAEPRIEFDTIPDAAATMLASRAVVGFSSTMLYEALAYGCHVAVVESPLAEFYADERIFPVRIRETDVTELLGALPLPPRATEQAIAESVWLPGAVERFAAEARG